MYKPAHITDSIEPSEEVVAAYILLVYRKGGRVIGANDALKSDCFVRANRLCHVGVAVVVKGFGEGGYLAVEVAEVGEVNVVFEVVYGGWDVGTHGFEVALAIGEAIVFAGNEGDDAVIGFGAGDDAGNAANGRERGVVGVQALFDAGFFGNGYHSFEEVFEVFPEAFFSDVAVVCDRGRVFHVAVIVGAGEGIAARAGGHRGAHPAKDGHPVVAHYGNARCAEVANGLTVLVDFLIATLKAQFDVVRDGNRFDNRPAQALVFNAFFVAQDGEIIPDGTSIG